MQDQAQRLREIFETRRTPGKVVSLRDHKQHIRTIAITSGKGGVGKTNLVANLAIALGRRGIKVLVVDADLSLANVDVLLGLQPTHNLSHVISGEKRLGEIVVEGPQGVKILPAASGIPELAMLREEQLQGLAGEFSESFPDMDLILVDTGAGLSEAVMCFVMAADEVCLVTTPEPTAYMDAYHMLKNIHRISSDKLVHLVVNMAISEREAQQTSSFFQQMSTRFLEHPLDSWGAVLRDPDVPQAIRLQRAFLEEAPHCIAARGIQGMATRLLNSHPQINPDSPGLWQRIVSYLHGKKGD